VVEDFGKAKKKGEQRLEHERRRTSLEKKGTLRKKRGQSSGKKATGRIQPKLEKGKDVRNGAERVAESPPQGGEN